LHQLQIERVVVHDQDHNIARLVIGRQLQAATFGEQSGSDFDWQRLGEIITLPGQAIPQRRSRRILSANSRHQPLRTNEI